MEATAAREEEMAAMPTMAMAATEGMRRRTVLAAMAATSQVPTTTEFRGKAAMEAMARDAEKAETAAMVRTRIVDRADLAAMAVTAEITPRVAVAMAATAVKAAMACRAAPAASPAARAAGTLPANLGRKAAMARRSPPVLLWSRLSRKNNQNCWRKRRSLPRKRRMSLMP